MTQGTAEPPATATPEGASLVLRQYKENVPGWPVERDALQDAMEYLLNNSEILASNNLRNARVKQATRALEISYCLCLLDEKCSPPRPFSLDVKAKKERVGKQLEAGYTAQHSGSIEALKTTFHTHPIVTGVFGVSLLERVREKGLRSGPGKPADLPDGYGPGNGWKM